MKELGSSAKRNRIANYLDTLPEEFEVLEDNLAEEEPSIKLQTKSRIITVSVLNGKVIENFRMRRGAGSKDEYLKKQLAYDSINTYYNDYYTGAKITKNSFEEGVLKIELATKIITLTYNSETNSVDEKERARRGTKSLREDDYVSAENVVDPLLYKTAEKHAQKTDIPYINSSVEAQTITDADEQDKAEPTEKKKRHRRTKAEMMAIRQKPVTNPEVKKLLDATDRHEYTQSTIYDFVDGGVAYDELKESEYAKISEGVIVKNRYNNKEYRVVRSSNTNMVEVFSKDNGGYITMARADIEVVPTQEVFE